MREKGKSTAEVARATLGRSGFLFYVAFALILCILVCAAFLQLAAVALTWLPRAWLHGLRVGPEFWG